MYLLGMFDRGGVFGRVPLGIMPTPFGGCDFRVVFAVVLSWLVKVAMSSLIRSVLVTGFATKPDGDVRSTRDGLGFLYGPRR